MELLQNELGRRNNRRFVFVICLAACHLLLRGVGAGEGDSWPLTAYGGGRGGGGGEGEGDGASRLRCYFHEIPQKPNGGAIRRVGGAF